jgi:putative transposase
MSLVTDHPVRLVCRLLDFPRCQLYRLPAEDAAPDTPLREALQQLAGQWPTYGYRRLTALLQRAGHVVNSKRIRRLMTAPGHPRPVARSPQAYHGHCP